MVGHTPDDRKLAAGHRQQGQHAIVEKALPGRRAIAFLHPYQCHDSALPVIRFAHRKPRQFTNPRTRPVGADEQIGHHHLAASQRQHHTLIIAAQLFDRRLPQPFDILTSITNLIQGTFDEVVFDDMPQIGFAGFAGVESNLPSAIGIPDHHPAVSRGAPGQNLAPGADIIEQCLTGSTERDDARSQRLTSNHGRRRAARFDDADTPPLATQCRRHRQADHAAADDDDVIAFDHVPNTEVNAGRYPIP